MTRNVPILILLSSFFIISGCAAFFAGTGAGVGVYSYVNGELKTSYHAEFDETNRICTDVLNSLEMEITEETSDNIKATIKAKQSDGTPVTIKTVKITPGTTEVSVRSGIVGIWDKKVSELIHASIAQRLQK
ncbi:MAG: DUF3568 family protein [Deltaproteobacteria bacterium]|nr:DUF3568 family protein [Deltaproteobacteria bacterium]MBW1957387.1 DUF3568 family protein [Deltaproteobacteria bacterium]MBW2012788.1 DUF3568 family protein [Deltaproteobacteria bacterium]MBW2088267.1 DUF3568 family protein [Deltaproteobacteria bacterium]MBW2319431.1 DUF3568 family protein [Deltaproteobacteria bacterium]